MEKKEQTEIVYHHSLPIQLRWNDADQFGHINNTLYFQYYDMAKMDYFANIPDTHVDHRHAIVTVHVDADFLSQVHIGDHVSVETAVTHIGHKSFRLSQRLVDNDTHEVKCVGTTIMVAYDLELNEAVEMWPEWVNAIEKFEGHNLRG